MAHMYLNDLNLPLDLAPHVSTNPHPYASSSEWEPKAHMHLINSTWHLRIKLPMLHNVNNEHTILIQEHKVTSI